MRKMMTTIFIIGIILLLVACSTPSKENLNEPTTNLVTETPPEVFITIDGERYSTLLGSYCWEKENEQTNEATIECVDKAPPEVLLVDETPINVPTNVDGELDIGSPTPPTDIEVTAFLDGEEIEVDRFNQTISFPTENGSYYYVAWLTWEDDDEVASEASYVFALEVE
ncbi:MAG TPA: hypothetical protein VK067_05675 [Pseudogracilibacillus sp.]|nr:hypothetical protein [Pseudogracilibacillus sp.]